MPRGFYELPSLFATTIVVLNELAEDRSTLILRLMGRGRTLERAIMELKTLSDDDFERSLAIPLLVRYCIEAANEPVSTADEEFLMTTQEIMDMYEKRAELRGELRGERKTVLKQLRRKFGELPENVVAQVQSADTQTLDRLEDKLLFAGSLGEVFAP